MIKEEYNFKNLLRAYETLGISHGKTIYLTGNIANLGVYEKRRKSELLSDHLKALQQLLGNEGTIVMPTHTWSLCNTQKVFDINNSVSETGALSEYLRKQPSAVRQLHPFSSSTALGKNAEYICTNNSKHVYGLNSPFQRLLELDAMHISLGMPIEHTISMVHHVELLMGVPYRYAKEFTHPCLLGGEIIEKEFYLYVNRMDVDITRDKNQKILNNYKKKHAVHQASLGRDSVYSLNLNNFVKTTADYLSEDIFGWLQNPPKKRESFRI